MCSSDLEISFMPFANIVKKRELFIKNLPPISLLVVVNRYDDKDAKRYGSDIDVAHVGFLLNNGSDIKFRHAGIIPKKVVQEDFFEYAKSKKGSKKLEGVMIFDIKLSKNEK